ncbi:MAG TPA: hypothetical protein VMT90_01450 [Dehalococcoidia bacterium]|nr:hypothetical protein [Dehalococcoidia bacterium]
MKEHEMKRHSIVSEMGAAVAVLIVIALGACSSNAEQTPSVTPASASPTANISPTPSPWPHLILTTSFGQQEGVLGTRSNEVGDIDASGFTPAQPVEASVSETVRFQFTEAVTPIEMGVGVSKIDSGVVEEEQGDQVLYKADGVRYLKGDPLPAGNTADYHLGLPPGDYRVAFGAKFSQVPFRQAGWSFHIKVVEDPS